MRLSVAAAISEYLSECPHLAIYLRVLYIGILISMEVDAVPKDKYILLLDNRLEQRLVRIADTKYPSP